MPGILSSFSLGISSFTEKKLAEFYGEQLLRKISQLEFQTAIQVDLFFRKLSIFYLPVTSTGVLFELFKLGGRVP